MRDEFSEAVVKQIAQCAMYICSNPDCLRLTGYGTSEGKARTIADGAHINAASKNGPRSVPHAAKYLKSASNGIWLCKICHKRVDDDPGAYPEELLHKWKSDHEEVVRRIVGKDLEAALLDLRNQKRSNQETREFVSFIENKRVLYEGMDQEFPPRVLESLALIRERLIQTRARVNPDGQLFEALNRLQMAIDDFLRNIGSDTDLRHLRCDSGDPRWVKFASELQKLRTGIVIIIKVLSGEADYRLSWV